jgi:uncharacterized YigZ family protein
LQRILTSAHAEQTINKSRFIAAVDYCENERAVAVALRKLASQHQGASHLAYAFRLKTEQGIVQRFSDAGEPSGTAGKPILQFLEGRDLINVCVGVIRYYGGINLGTGGLARAYGGTAKMALEAARTGPYVEMRQYRLQLSYNKLDQFVRELQQRHGEVRDKQFGEYVQLEISLPLSEEEWLVGRYGTP